jgi:16S rRNA (cytosine1402-N4)-methyltransferase
MKSNKHISVLLNEAIDALNIKENGIYVDATLGRGGHSSKILEKLTNGHLYAFDEDDEAILYCKEKFKNNNNITLIHSNFENIKEELTNLGITKIDGIIYDLGLSSPEIDNKERGFSFMQDAPLDMRMDRRNKLSAKNVVNEYKYEELYEIFFKYGEEDFSKPIAKMICNSRPINTTLELVEIIKKAVPTKYFNLKHPERRIFQSIRIEVNNEINVLEDSLKDAINLLDENGRVAVITFHSLEDRIVKKTFRKYSEIDEIVKGLPIIPDKYKPILKIINKKPILPSNEEMIDNTRSKSAKLRVAERLGN